MRIPSRLTYNFTLCLRPPLPRTPSIGAVAPHLKLPTLSALGPSSSPSPSPPRHVRVRTASSYPRPTNTPTTPRPSPTILLPQLPKLRRYYSTPTPTTLAHTVKMADRVHRVTMFKLPNKQHQETLIAAYKVLSSEQKRDGKPYILSLVVGPALDDPRSKGFTLVAKTEFASLGDMRWYDSDCPAHDKLKGLVREFGIGPDDVLSIYFEPGHVAVI